jgi:hypothetical protein
MGYATARLTEGEPRGVIIAPTRRCKIVQAKHSSPVLQKAITALQQRKKEIYHPGSIPSGR